MHSANYLKYKNRSLKLKRKTMNKSIIAKKVTQIKTHKNKIANGIDFSKSDVIRLFPLLKPFILNKRRNIDLCMRLCKVIDWSRVNRVRGGGKAAQRRDPRATVLMDKLWRANRNKIQEAYS